MKRVAGDAVVSGSAASLASAATLMACSKLHEGSAAGGLNGPSQWLWGESEAYTREASFVTRSRAMLFTTPLRSSGLCCT